MDRIDINNTPDFDKMIESIVDKLNEIIDWINSQQDVFYIDRNQVKKGVLNGYKLGRSQL